MRTAPHRFNAILTKPIFRKRTCIYVPFFLSLLFVLSGNVFGSDLDITSYDYVIDRPFPDLIQSVWDGWDLKIGMRESWDYQELLPPGATLHLFIHNQSDQEIKIEHLQLNGIDLKEHLIARHREHGGIRACSYLLNDATTTPPEIKKRLDQLGQPIWYQIQPNPVPAGGFAEASVRFRRVPEEKNLKVCLEAPERKPARARIPNRSSRGLAVASVNLSPEMDRLFLYLRHREGGEFVLQGVQLDGEEIPLPARRFRRSCRGFLPVEIPLSPAWEPGSFHHVAAVSRECEEAAAVVRAREPFFALGLWGYRNHGNTDEQRARDTATAFRDHLFNTHMGMAGRQTGFLESAAGLEMLEELGLRLKARDPTKDNCASPQLYARFLLDEPDAHDYAVRDLPGHLRVGSFAQGLIERQRSWTRRDPRTLTLLNVDLTYKPQNWLIYGPIPDILAVDPYYQMRLKDVYRRHPGWLAQFSQPYYVFAVSEIARYACEPRALHVILNSVSPRADGPAFRYGTPEEKRIEFYYALAAGAKGISYWWFTPYGKFVGCGSDDPAARAMMREMARLNAEARALEPLLGISHPVAASGARVDPLASVRPPWLMTRTLFAGPGTALLVLINRDHGSDRLGTLYEPIPKAPMAFQCPAWLEPHQAFRLSGGKVESVSFERQEDQLTFQLNDIELTDLVVFTEDAGLMDSVSERTRDLLADLEEKGIGYDNPRTDH